MKASRKALGIAIVAATLSMLPWAGAAADTEEQIVDVAGDAHGVTQPYHDGGAYGVLTSTLADLCTLVTGGPDCTGYGTPVDAISSDEADLLGVRIETLYEAIPVGDDGIDYRATGIGINLRTTAVPRRAGDAVTFRTLAELPGPECKLNLYVSVPETGAPTGDVNLHSTTTLADPCGDLAAHTALDGSNVQVTTSPPGLRITVPYALFGPSITGYLGEGTSIMRPWVHSTIIADVTENPIGWAGDMLDKTPRYVGFFVGDDMPTDVPCTRRCP